MPLLRLPRNPRSCHLARGVFHARYSSTVPRTSHSTDGDDLSAADEPSSSPPHAPTKPPAVAEAKTSWWSSVKHSIASFGSQAAASKPPPIPIKSSELRSANEQTPAHGQRSPRDLSDPSTQVLHNEELFEIRRQLEKLSEQIAKLQSAVTPKASAALPNATPIGPSGPNHTASLLHRRGRRRYRKSIIVLASAANALEGMSPHIATILAPLAIERLAAIRAEAIQSADFGAIRDLSSYSGDVSNLIPKEKSATFSGHDPLVVQSTHISSSDQPKTIPIRESTDSKLLFFINPDNASSPKEPQTAEPLKEVSKPSNKPSEPSLLQELFPEASNSPQAENSKRRYQYPKLDLPDPPLGPSIRRVNRSSPKTLKEQVVESFQNKGEKTTVLQLTHCSTELVEADFRRLIPKGSHIESWHREGEFSRVIPGRDPLSLERMPFYYILFKDAESALAYQKNVSRIHKLSALHQPSNIFSAIPPPKGFLEDGEDINTITSWYNLLPTNHPISLSTLMQPYNPALRALIQRGGYHPIVSAKSNEEQIWKVLMHIEGYEPTLSDLFKIFRHDAFTQGLPVLSIRNESIASIHRLRDMLNLRTVSIKAQSSDNPRAYGSFDHSNPPTNRAAYEDPEIQHVMAGADEDMSSKDIHQMVINRIYNRWIVDFSDEDAARRFARRWHRRELPDLLGKSPTWKDTEELRVCNTEFLW